MLGLLLTVACVAGLTAGYHFREQLRVVGKHAVLLVTHGRPRIHRSFYDADTGLPVDNCVQRLAVSYGGKTWPLYCTPDACDLDVVWAVVLATGRPAAPTPASRTGMAGLAEAQLKGPQGDWWGSTAKHVLVGEQIVDWETQCLTTVRPRLPAGSRRFGLGPESAAAGTSD